MHFLIIIPAHNEAEYIGAALESLSRQDYRDFRCVVVDDGSSDATAEIVRTIAGGDSRFVLQQLPASEHQPGAKVVRTFMSGLQSQELGSTDIICKFDADVIFPPDYLSEIKKIYENDPHAGMASGIVKISNEPFSVTEAFDFNNKNGQWQFENISSKNHVRGPIKSYHKACFQEINGLRPVLGWDNIDVMLAQQHGWRVITNKELWGKHLRPTAYKYKTQKAEKLGEYFYNIGLDFPLAFISSAKSSLKNKSLRELIITLRSFLKQKAQRHLTEEEIAYIRKLRWRQMLKRK